MRDRRLGLVTLAVAMALAACSRSAADDQPAATGVAVAASETPRPVDPTQSPTASPPPAIGTPLEAPARPPDETCDELQRNDREAAMRIRTSVDLAMTGVGTVAEDVDAAATDPTADIGLIGIPLLPDEVQILRTGGMYLDERAPLAFWVMSGRDDLFGGYWVDPPLSSRFVVGVVDGDQSSMELVECLRRGDLDVRYVFSERSWRELLDWKDEVVADMNALRAEGVPITSVGPDMLTNTLEVGVDGLTDEMAAVLRERYGAALRLEDEPPAVAD